jgi:hypothetical protein
MNVTVRFVCGECNADLEGGDEGSAPSMIAVGGGLTPHLAELGGWTFDLSDMACPAILEAAMLAEGEWSEMLGERWSAFVDRHQAAWRVVVTCSTSEGATS